MVDLVSGKKFVVEFVWQKAVLNGPFSRQIRMTVVSNIRCFVLAPLEKLYSHSPKYFYEKVTSIIQRNNGSVSSIVALEQKQINVVFKSILRLRLFGCVSFIGKNRSFRAIFI